MKFEIIPNEQTPKLDEIEDIELFFINNINELTAFKEFAETLTHAAGLAANQCSIDSQRFMVRAFALMDLQTNKWRIIVDPKIIEYVGIKEIKCEGCLTWVGKKVVAERSRAVKVQYYDEIGVKYIETHKGFDAQVWQHEINHLNGVPEQIEEYDYREPKQLDIGRNEKCLCGSGKKYKNCCLLLL